MAIIHVVAGIILNQRAEILIAKRPAGKHLEGLWEFPGGKVEAGEDALSALRRELAEEIGISLLEAKPYKQIRHCYPEKQVLLDFWLVLRFGGIASGAEGQQIRWVSLQALKHYAFPEANQKIIHDLEYGIKT